MYVSIDSNTVNRSAVMRARRTAESDSSTGKCSVSVVQCSIQDEGMLPTPQAIYVSSMPYGLERRTIQ